MSQSRTFLVGGALFAALAGCAPLYPGVRSEPMAQTSARFKPIGEPSWVAPPPPMPGIGGGGRSYWGTGGGHWVRSTFERGRFVALEDGSLWEVSMLDRLNSSLWLMLDNIVIAESWDPAYPYRLVNTNGRTSCAARCLKR